MTIAEIIARLENATGPSVELDEEIRLAVAAESINYGSAEGLVSTDECHGPPEYTSSLDVALTLVPNGHEIHDWFIGNDGSSHLSLKDPGKRDWFEVGESDHSAAIALCIAALRAREATERAG
jgi:hypothetical protein